MNVIRNNCGYGTCCSGKSHHQIPTIFSNHPVQCTRSAAVVSAAAVTEHAIRWQKNFAPPWPPWPPSSSGGSPVADGGKWGTDWRATLWHVGWNCSRLSTRQDCFVNNEHDWRNKSCFCNYLVRETCEVTSPWFISSTSHIGSEWRQGSLCNNVKYCCSVDENCDDSVRGMCVSLWSGRILVPNHFLMVAADIPPNPGQSSALSIYMKNSPRFESCSRLSHSFRPQIHFNHSFHPLHMFGHSFFLVNIMFIL